MVYSLLVRCNNFHIIYLIYLQGSGVLRMFWLLVLLRWLSLLVAIYLLIAIIGEFNPNYMIGFIVFACAFLFIPKMPIYSTHNYKDVEYSRDGKKPYDTHISKLDGGKYSIETSDDYGLDNAAYMEATRKGNEFIVDDDDVEDNYQDYVSEVKFKISDMGKKIQEYDYIKYSKKPTKQHVQKLIKQE